MKNKTVLDAELRALAEAQSGVLSRAQLLGYGLSRRVIARFLADGIVDTLTPGIYRLGTGSAWLGRAWAGLLLGGESSVLGLETAGHLHGVIKDEPAEITVFTPDDHVNRLGWRFIRSSRTGSGEPTRTGLESTVLDLCAGRDEDELAALLADVISSRRTTAKRLLTELAERRRQPSRRLLRDILGDVETGAHSALERRFLVNVERAHGLPEAVRQARAGYRHRADAWYHEFGVLAELDSKLHHTGGAAFRDMARDNDHARAGLLTLRLGWGDVSGVAACRTALVVGQVLMSRGWEGPIQPCDQCRLAIG